MASTVHFSKTDEQGVYKCTVKGETFTVRRFENKGGSTWVARGDKGTVRDHYRLEGVRIELSILAM